MPDAGQKDSKFDAHPQNSTRLRNSMEKMMEEKDPMKDSTREATAETEQSLGAVEHAQAAQITIDTKGRLGRGPVITASLVAVLLVIGIRRKLCWPTTPRKQPPTRLLSPPRAAVRTIRS
jgi:hypothetical protein